MPFSVRHFLEDDKLCHHMNLEVLQGIYPQEVVEQVLYGLLPCLRSDPGTHRRVARCQRSLEGPAVPQSGSFTLWNVQTNQVSWSQEPGPKEKIK